MSTVHYLAYGSNLHPLRLVRRVPSARLIGVVELLGHRLAFHKRGSDRSGKCLTYPGQDARHCVLAALYEFEAHERARLDEVEGEGKGYRGQAIPCRIGARNYRAYIYVAQAAHVDARLVPYDWYKRLVVAGALYHGFPAQYVASLEAVPSKPDPDLARARENEDLLALMAAYEPGGSRARNPQEDPDDRAG